MGGVVAAALDNTDTQPADVPNWRGSGNALRRAGQTDSLTTRMDLAGVLCSFDVNDLRTYDSYGYAWTLADHARHIANYLAAMAERNLPVIFILGLLRDPATISNTPYTQLDLINLYKAASDASSNAAYIDMTEKITGSTIQQTYANYVAQGGYWLSTELPSPVHPGSSGSANLAARIAKAILEAA